MATKTATKQNGVATKVDAKKATSVASKNQAEKSAKEIEEKIIPLEPVNIVAKRKEQFRKFFALQEKHEKLTNTQHKLSELINQNDPIDGSIQLVIKEKDAYRDEGAFLTSNQEIIGEALLCLKSKVDLMIDEVKTEILEASI